MDPTSLAFRLLRELAAVGKHKQFALLAQEAEGAGGRLNKQIKTSKEKAANAAAFFSLWIIRKEKPDNPMIMKPLQQTQLAFG